jgi:hypothetical protein
MRERKGRVAQHKRLFSHIGTLEAVKEGVDIQEKMILQKEDSFEKIAESLKELQTQSNELQSHLNKCGC